MSTLVVEINDTGVQAWDDEAASVLSSPGYALLGSGGVVAVGEEARAEARLQPRAVHDRFWDDLSLEPLALPGGGAGNVRTSADIAFEHLSRVWAALRERDVAEVFLAVPGTYDRDQLALVLGIARECGLPVAGMVDAAVAAVSIAGPTRALVHLDVHRHRGVVTRFTLGEYVSRAGVESSRGHGLRDLHEGWLSAIANDFVQLTRFDPLHQAEHEQSLYQQLATLPARLAREPRQQIEVATANATHAVPIDAQTLQREAAEHYRQLAELVATATTQGEAVTLRLSHRAAILPGLAERLGELPGVEVQVLPATAVPRGVRAMAPALRQSAAAQDGVPFLTQAPWDAVAEGDAPVARPRLAPAADQVPTHVVYAGVALGLATTPLTVGAQAVPEAEGRSIVLGAPLRGVSRRHCQLRLGPDGGAELVDTSTHGTWLNGRRIEGRASLRIGDRLRIGTPGHELHLVRVVS